MYKPKEYRHIPVMLKEVLEYLEPKEGGRYVDCTLGGAGYTMAIAKAASKVRVLSIDLDMIAIRNAEELIAKQNLTNIKIVNDNFRNLAKNIEESFGAEALHGMDGVVFDLGLSSAQLEDRDRGFSFQADTPLNMSFSGDPEKTEEIINEWSEAELQSILKEYGEEPFARQIARRIVAARKIERIKTTGQLVEIIKSALPGFRLRKKGIHFATLTFQALRIATNEELESLKEALEQSLEALKPGGRIVVISYHSLEDRIVKHFFKHESKGCICPPRLPICQCHHEARLKILTPKIILPGEEEIGKNPRARSAKLRAVEII